MRIVSLNAWGGAMFDAPVRHASYLLVSDPDAVTNFEIVAEPEVSDHRALVLDVPDPPRSWRS